MLSIIICSIKSRFVPINLSFSNSINFCENLYLCPPKIRKKYENMVTNNGLINFDIEEMANFDNMFRSYSDKVNWFKNQKFIFKIEQ